MNDGITSLYQVIEFPFRPRRRRLPPPRRRRPRRCRASCGVVAPPSAGCRAAALRRFLRWCRFKSAPSGGLRGWAPTRPPLLHRRKAAQKLKMYALSSGGGSFCRRRFSSSPWPSLAAARSAGRARSRAGGVPPATPAPLGRLCALPPFGRRRFAPVAAAACSVLPSGKGVASRCAALALVCALAALRRGRFAVLRPIPSSGGSSARCGASSRSSSLGGALVGWGACGPPLAAPSGFAALSLPRRGPAARASPAPFCASVPRREKVFCRRCGGDGEKPLRRLICADSGSAQRAIARLFIASTCPNERQLRSFLSTQEKHSALPLSE